MIYELRIYSCIPGRMPALLKRFEEQTMKLWEKHAIKQAGFWTVLVGNGNNDLYYLLAWESLADREKKWNAFQADPAWHKAARRARKTGNDHCQRQQLLPAADKLLRRQIIERVARGLDHAAHAVRDIDAVAALYRRLGFAVGARNRHAPEWGTQNHIVQLPGFFIELLSLADVSAIAPHAARFFSFGAFNRDFLNRKEGLSLLVLEGHDSEMEAQDFRDAGIGDFEVYRFTREAKRPDGTPTQVAFSLAYARDDKAPDIGFFACRQTYPENFWNPAFQQHANGVTGIAGVVLIADEPEDHRAFFAAFVGTAEIVSHDGRYHRRHAARRYPGSDAACVHRNIRCLAARYDARCAARGAAFCSPRSGADARNFAERANRF